MVVATRRRTRIVFAVLALVAAASVADAALLWRAAQTNAAITAWQSIAQAPGQPPQIRFAQAYALTQAQAASGARSAALNRYRPLQNDPQLGAPARYNSANLLVRQAVEVRTSTQPGQAIALLELAKEYYRDVLRDDPAQWDARYNLERAQRLLPDPGEEEAEPPEQAQNRERAATTMRAFSPGMP